jgi:hypothetical protein
MLQNSDSINVLTLFVYYAAIMLDASHRETYIYMMTGHDISNLALQLIGCNHTGLSPRANYRLPLDGEVSTNFCG